MMVHDIIKIKYVREGYLPNYPPHLISDEEMCIAFLQYVRDFTDEPVTSWEQLNDEINHSYVGYYIDWYLSPLLTQFQSEAFPYESTLAGAILNLTDELSANMNKLIDYNRSNSDESFVLPDWVYSFMLGRVVGPKSDTLEKHDLLVLLDTDNTDDNFDGISSYSCYQVSRLWVNKLKGDDMRPPTVFGEPHVIKSLRLQQVI